MVKNERAGKKCIGIAKPGNNSGISISKGSLNESTPIIEAKLTMAKRILAQPRNFSLFHLNSKMYAVLISIHPINEAIVMPCQFNIVLKSTVNALEYT